MSCEFDRQKREIADLIHGSPADEPAPVRVRLLALAKSGLDNPDALSREDVQQLCFAVVTHYLKMGID